MRFRHSLIGYNRAQTDSLMDQEATQHQAALEHKQSQLEELLTYQQHLQRQQNLLTQMLQKSRSRNDIFESFSEALQQYFGRSEQRNRQEIEHCREAVLQLEAEINQQEEKLESDVIALETFLASVEKHLGDLVTSLGQEFQAGQDLLSEYTNLIHKSAPATGAQESVVNLEKLKWNPDTPAEAAAAALPAEIVQAPVIPGDVLAGQDDEEAEISFANLATGPASQEVIEAPSPREENVLSPVSQPAEPSKPDAVNKLAASRPRAFTTDDDATIQSILKVMLEREGFEVIQAGDGREASRMIDSIDPPDIAILDLMLPYVDGLQLTRQIRSKADWGETPILILSSNSTENEMVTLLEAGADDYVIKPFNTRELIARVKRLSEAPVK